MKKLGLIAIGLILPILLIGQTSKTSCNSGKSCLELGHKQLEQEKYDSALASYKKSCNFNYVEGCGTAFNFLNTSQSLDVAINFLSQSCDNNKNAVACSLIGYFYFKDENYTKALPYAIKGCNLQNALSCLTAAGIYENNKNTAKYLEFGKKACDLKDTEDRAGVCREVGLEFTKIQNYKQALSAFTTACNLQDAASCVFVSEYYFDDDFNIKQNIAKSFETAKKACDLGLHLGCGRLALNYGVFQRNIHKAKEYAKKACNMGLQEACQYYQELLQ